MKRYKVNKRTGTTKVWKYSGMADDSNEIIRDFERMNGRDGVTGLKITDTATGKIIYNKEI